MRPKASKPEPTMKNSIPALTVALLSLCLSITAATAQTAAPSPAAAPAEPKPAQSEAPSGVDAPKPGQSEAPSRVQPPAEAQPSAEQVLNELLKRRAENPLIEPTRPETTPASADRPAASSTAPSAIGTAPSVSQAAPLRREGQFVITRRARMVRAPGGGPGWLLVFESDGSAMQDPPMYILPCQLLEDMETIVQQQGDAAVFTVSGQIFVYRDANYIMPTLSKLAPSRDNLQP
jgi:hypothetical protein